MEGEHNETVYEPVGEIRPSQFELSGRTQNRAQESEEDFGPVRCGHLNQRKFRYIAFRQLVRWFWGYLGKHVRVALPSCAVNKIRSTFLAEFGTSYTGLKPPSL